MNQCFILHKTGSYICMFVLCMLYQNMFLLCHSIFGTSGKEQHSSVKIIWGSHRDGSRSTGATCQWAIISGVLVGRISPPPGLTPLWCKSVFPPHYALDSFLHSFPLHPSPGLLDAFGYTLQLATHSVSTASPPPTLALSATAPPTAPLPSVLHSQTTSSVPSHPLRHPKTGVSPTHMWLLADWLYLSQY